MGSVEPIIVSYSELDTYRQCPLKHFISYGQRWTKPPQPGGALAKGSLYHAMQEINFKMIKTYQDMHHGKSPKRDSEEEVALIQLIREAIRPHLWDSRSGQWHSDVHELIDWMMEGWWKNYGCMPEWRVMGIEHQITTPLRDERGRRTRYHLKAKLDLIVRIRSLGTLWVVDHKSGANLPTDMDLEIDDQFGLYTWAMNEVGRPVTGSLHAGNRTQRNKGPMALDTRMKLTYLNRSDTELRNIALDAYNVARAAHPPRSATAPRYSSPDPRQCGWKCDLKEPHLLMRRGRDMSEVLREYGYKIDKTRH